MEVDVEIQRVAKALDEGDGAELPARDPRLLPGAALQRGKDSAHEHIEHVAHEWRVEAEPVAQRKGQRERPLPHLAPRAGEGDGAIESAAVAVHAHEAMREDPAAQEGAQLARGRAGDEGLKIVNDRPQLRWMPNRESARPPLAVRSRRAT